MKTTTIKKSMIITALIVSMSGLSLAQADDQWRGQDNRGNNPGHQDRGDRGNDRGNGITDCP